MTPIDNHMKLPPFSREEVASVLEDWARECAPRRFVVYGIEDDPDHGGYDGDVIAWGLGFDDYVYVQSPNSGVTGKFKSAESMRHIMFHSERDVRILWIDPESHHPQG